MSHPADFTPMQEAFIREMLSDAGITPTEAARRAGYSDCEGEAKRLLSTSSVVNAILRPVRKEIASWRELVGSARRVLENKMKDYRHVTAMSNCKVCGEETAHVTDIPIKDTVQLNAAKIVFTTMARSAPGALADKASNEDNAEALPDVADRILGKLPEVIKPTDIN